MEIPGSVWLLYEMDLSCIISKQLTYVAVLCSILFNPRCEMIGRVITFASALDK